MTEETQVSSVKEKGPCEKERTKLQLAEYRGIGTAGVALLIAGAIYWLFWGYVSYTEGFLFGGVVLTVFSWGMQYFIKRQERPIQISAQALVDQD